MLPTGLLFFADLRNMDGVNTLREQFDARGMALEKEADITTNALTVLRLDNARKRKTSSSDSSWS